MVDDVTVSLWNHALTQIGAAPLVGPDDTTENASRCRQVWDVMRRGVLRPYPWNCAMARARLAADATPPAWGYANAFPVPADCLTVWEVAGQKRAGGGWTVEQGRILSDRSGPLDIRYIADIAPHQMDGHLFEMLAKKLAATLAFSVTGNATLAATLGQQASTAEILARNTDAREAAEMVTLGADQWLEARL